MAKQPFTPGASWIWSAEARRPYNNFVCFRRSFDLAAAPVDAELRITADSRYEVHVNGEWLGHGPPRSWESPWPVDHYDLRGRLRKGRNTVAVLVQHFGIGTFQYLHADAGLLAELTWKDAGGRKTLATDGEWLCLANAGHAWPVPRISCMQAWEEQFDARELPGDWVCPDFDDRSWRRANVVRPAGAAPHERLEPRTIAMLTRDPVAPARFIAAEAVLPARYTWTVNPRDLLNPRDKTANILAGTILLATYIRSPRPQAVQIHPPHFRPVVAYKLNGSPLRFDDMSLQATETGVARARLRKGWNLLLIKVIEDHYWWAVLNLWTDHPVRFSAWPLRRKAATPWLAVGPCAVNPDEPSPMAPPGQHMRVDAAPGALRATPEQLEAIWQRGTLSEAELASDLAQPLPPDMVTTTDVYAKCASERVIPKVKPRVEGAQHLLCETPEWTTIHPLARGDVRILLDFGREVVGYHEFEIDAPAGAVVDNHNFEFIQPDGRKNLAESMNNSFRYVCREGVQRYRTFTRRGFRYSWFTFRNFRRPIRLRSVRVLMSTYPQARRGSLACSDALLERIWEVGAHSLRCCSEDTYTDCPTYEQTFWVGDARNEAMVDLVANGEAALSEHSWMLAARSLDRSPLVEGQVPSGWESLLPTWSFLWMRWAHEHHLLTGDARLARRMIPYLQRNVRGLERHLSERGLFKIFAWNMFDWAAMDTPSGGEVTHLNCLAVLGLRECAMLASSIGRPREAAQWRALADRLAGAVNRHLWDDARGAYIDCIRPDGTRSPVFSQQTQTVAFTSGVAQGARADACRRIMEKAPEGFVQAGSPFFMFFLLEGLARQGRIDSLVQLVRDYWGKQIEAGATTFWETFYEGAARLTRSHCHGWSAAPTFFLSQYLLGVRPLEPGYARVLIAPQPCGLRWARGEVPTPRGNIACAWESSDKQFTLRIDLPPGLVARIELPTAGTVVFHEGKGNRLRGRGGLPVLETRNERIALTLNR
jgi:hypothetical protein